VIGFLWWIRPITVELEVGCHMAIHSLEEQDISGQSGSGMYSEMSFGGECKWEGKRRDTGVVKSDSNILIHLALDLVVILNLLLMVFHYNKWVPSKEVIWSRNIMWYCHKRWLCLVKWGIILHRGSKPPLIWDRKEGGNCKSIGSDLLNQMIDFNKQSERGMRLDCWMRGRGNSGIHYLSWRYDNVI